MKIFQTIVLLLLLLSTGSLILQAAEPDTRLEKQTTPEDIKKKDVSYFLFYFRQKFLYEGDTTVDDLDLISEFNFKYIFAKPSFRLSIRVNDMFVSDFNALSTSIQSGSDFSTTAGATLYNSLFTSITTRFKIKNAFKLSLTTDIGLDYPFNSSTVLLFEPGIRLKGDYYFGFFWDIWLSIPIDLTIGDDISQTYSSVAFSSYTEAGYEFFRFYGPRKFNFSVVVNNLIKITNNTIFDDSFENKFKAGLQFAFFKFEPSLYFTWYTNSALARSGAFLLNNSPGIEVEWYTQLKWFSFSIKYAGSQDVSTQGLQWVHSASVYLLFQMTKSHEHKKESKPDRLK